MKIPGRKKIHSPFAFHPSLLTKSGFTLLEIMISLAIIGGLLVTLIYSLNYHLGIAERHEFVTIATSLAKNKMVEIEKAPVASKGEFAAPYSGYHYSAELRASQYPGINELTVTVGKGSEEVKFTELIEKKR